MSLTETCKILSFLHNHKHPFTRDRLGRIWALDAWTVNGEATEAYTMIPSLAYVRTFMGY